MKIKRFVAKDMRAALAEVKQTLGADAVILSNKKIAGGVEIVAAVDAQAPVKMPAAAPRGAAPAADEPAEDRVSLGARKPAVAEASLGGVNAPARAAAIAASLQELMARNVQAPPAASGRNPTATARPQAADLARPVKFPRVTPAAAERLPLSGRSVLGSANDEIQQVRQELTQLRALLQHQVSGLLWQEMERSEPLRALLIKRLQDLGFERTLADQIACYIPEEWSEEQAWPQVLGLLAEQLKTGRDEILRQGGVVALVGPTGVGKTTTVAKLAARFAMTHGPDAVALISTDTYRIGAHEQLSTYARIIGCQFKVAANANELTEALNRFRNRKLVLIDTAGMSQRDERLQAHLETLLRDSQINVRSYLVLSANAQRRVMQEAVAHFRCIPLAGMIASKVDECLSLGEILGVAIQNSLSISYLTDGQRVPEDLAVADARHLVELANRLLEQSAEAAYPWMAGQQSVVRATRYEQQ